MKRGRLADEFLGVVSKVITAVEASPAKSHQHEFNGSQALRALFGDADRLNFPARFIWLSEDEQPVTVDGLLSWYDSRRAHPTRTEYRLYYRDNEVTLLMSSGDLFYLALRPDGSALVIITVAEGTIRNQLDWLFGIDGSTPEKGFVFTDIGKTNNPELGFAARYILDELGLEQAEPEADYLDGLIDPFGLVFPKTQVFSTLARQSLPDISPLDDPDLALISWMEREEQLFRRLERRIVASRIAGGFMQEDGPDVEGFLGFSLSVQNRRKARAGMALENHLEAVFTACSISHERGAKTENRNRPDFLFPGAAQYANPQFPASRLTMLGAKSTLKDRWRQVLSEAVRIPEKHLLTLEPGISENQTDEMQAKNLQLVLPQSLHMTFKPAQQQWLMNLKEFIALVRGRQEENLL